VATDFPDHFAQLDAALRDNVPDDGRCRRFVEAFVRPYGVDIPATPKLVGAIEAAATRAAVPTRSAPRVARALRPFLERWGDQLRRDADLMAEAKAVAIAQRRQEAKNRKKQVMKERARQAREAASSAVNQQGPSENDHR
jgi:hypothetical protein